MGHGKQEVGEAGCMFYSWTSSDQKTFDEGVKVFQNLSARGTMYVDFANSALVISRRMIFIQFTKNMNWKDAYA